MDRRIDDVRPEQGLEWEQSEQDKDATIAALNQQLAAARNEALEEAAMLCESDDQEYEIGRRCAAAIRALASNPVREESKAEKLAEALCWALEWIDAVPEDTMLPAMPGFDRDYVNDLLASHPAAPAPYAEPQSLGDLLMPKAKREALEVQHPAAPVALNKDVEWLMQCAEEAQSEPEVATKIRAHCIAAAKREASHPAAPVQPDGSGKPTLHSRLMEISDIVRKGVRWGGNEHVFAELSESDASMIDDILGDALRLCRAAPPAQQTGDVRDTLPTEISERLRERARGGYTAVSTDDGALMLKAADEIERYYGGMLAWKKTAEKKDADWNAERMARVDDRIAARQALATTRPSAALTDERIMHIAEDEAITWVTDEGRPDNSTIISFARAILAASGGAHAVHQFRKQGCAEWYDGYPDNCDGGGPYDVRTLYAAPTTQDQGGGK